MKNGIYIFLILVGILLLSVIAVKLYVHPKDTISISTTVYTYPVIKRLADEYSQIEPGIVFDVKQRGSENQCFDYLKNGNSNICFASQPEALLKEQPYSNYWNISISKRMGVFFFNKNNPYQHEILKHGINDTIVSLMFFGKMETWGDFLDNKNISQSINLYRTRSAKLLISYIGESPQDDPVKYAGKIELSQKDLIKSVQKDTFGLGYCFLYQLFDPTTKEILDNVSIMPFSDSPNKENMIHDTYEGILGELNNFSLPKNLKQQIHCFSLQKPNEEIIKFLKWSIQYGDEYILDELSEPLSKEQREENLKKL